MKFSLKAKAGIVLAFIIILVIVIWVGAVQTKDSSHNVNADQSPTAQAVETATEKLVASPLEMDTAIDQSKKKKLQTLVEEKLEENNFWGTVLIGAGDKVLLCVSTGECDMKNKAKNTENTKYEIGSMTKQFTAAGIVKLANSGKLNLNDKVSKYFKDTHFGNATVENLLTMTSGIPDYLNDNIFAVEVGDKPETSKYSKDEFKKWLNTRELAFDPGSNFAYSNTNYYMLGLIIEQVTGESYEDYMTKEILTPLQMYDTSFNMDDATATGYLTTQGEKSTHVDSSYFYSAGEMVSTTDDIFRWLCGFDTGVVTGEKMLKASVSNSKSGFNYGYGWFIDYNGDYYYHTGNTEAFYGVDLVSFVDDIKVVALSNINDINVQQIGKDLLKLTEEELYPKNHQTTEPVTENSTEKSTQQ